MPIKKSAKKALRKSIKNHQHNQSLLDNIKSLRKEIEKTKQGDPKMAELLVKFQKAVDKAAKKNVIKKNTASRKKSRITKKAAKKAAK